MGGIIGAAGAPAKFGRAVSVDPTDPTTFLVGHPTAHLLGPHCDNASQALM